MDLIPTPFGERVAAIRQSLGIPQSKVPGISQPRLSKIERGKEPASVISLLALLARG
jgi:transcriptional regulator with XRE-family HTH domain